jgi:hypothetical protein
MQTVEEIMMNFRKAAIARSSLLVWISLSLMLVGRYGFEGGLGRHGLMSLGEAVLAAAMVVLIFDLRKSREVCVAGR